MPIFPTTQKFRIALGGFVFFIGIVLFILGILSITKNSVIHDAIQPELLIGFVGVLGLLNVICGAILVKKAQ